MKKNKKLWSLLFVAVMLVSIMTVYAYTDTESINRERSDWDKKISDDSFVKSPF